MQGVDRPVIRQPGASEDAPAHPTMKKLEFGRKKSAGFLRWRALVAPDDYGLSNPPLPVARMGKA